MPHSSGFKLLVSNTLAVFGAAVSSGEALLMAGFGWHWSSGAFSLVKHPVQLQRRQSISSFSAILYLVIMVVVGMPGTLLMMFGVSTTTANAVGVGVFTRLHVVSVAAAVIITMLKENSTAHSRRHEEILARLDRR